MVRIVSGTQQEDPNAPLLAGMQLGQAWRQARQGQQEEQRRQMEAMAEIQSTAQKLQKERAKALEDANARAELGDVRAMQQQEMERMAQNLPPDRKRLQEGLQLRSRLKTDDAIKLFDADFAKRESEIQAHEQKQAALGFIERAMADKVPGSENAQTRLATGEEPETIAKELNDNSVKAAAQKVNMAEAQKSVEQAQQSIEASPVGPREKKIAQFVLQRFLDSPSMQADPDSGPKMLQEVETALFSARDKQVARYVSAHKDKDYAKNLKALLKGTDEQFGEKAFMASNETLRRLQERFAGAPDQESTPAMTQHVKKQRAEKEKRYPGSTAKPKPGARQVDPTALRQVIDQAPSADHVLGALQQNGIDPNSDEGAQAILDALKGGNASQPAD